MTPCRAGVLLAFLLLAVFPTISSTADVSTFTTYFPVPSTRFGTNTASQGLALTVRGNVNLARDVGDVVLNNAEPSRREDTPERPFSDSKVLVWGDPYRGRCPGGWLQPWQCSNVADGDDDDSAPDWYRVEQLRVYGTLEIGGCIMLPNSQLQPPPVSGVTGVGAHHFRCGLPP